MEVVSQCFGIPQDIIPFFFFSFFSSIGNFISSSKTRKTIAAHAAKRDPLTLQLTESSAGADFNDGTTVSLT